MRYCGMLSPHLSLQYHSLSHYKRSRSLDAFDIKFEGIPQFMTNLDLLIKLMVNKLESMFGNAFLSF